VLDYCGKIQTGEPTHGRRQSFIESENNPLEPVNHREKPESNSGKPDCNREKSKDYSLQSGRDQEESVCPRRNPEKSEADTRGRV
jgi:hypothetical protein